MKTTSTSKRLVSLLLAVIMVLSMMTVGMVTSFAAQTDIAQTGATKTYYFGFTSWSSLHKAWFDGGSVASADYVSRFKNENKTISYDIGTNGNKTYNVYSVTVDSSYTGAYITVANGNSYPETPKITLDSSKITLVTEWNGGAIFGQTAYSGGGGSETTDEFPIDFVDGSRTIYLVDEAGWGSSKCYAWTDGTSNSNAAWPGVDMTDTGKTMNGYKIYSYTVDSAFNKVIFYNADSKRTGDLDFTQYGYYNNKTFSWSTKSPTTPTQPTEPTTPWEPGNFTQICFRDDSNDSIDDNYDTDVYVSLDGGATKNIMTKTVDKMSGHDMWTYELKTAPASSASIKFYGVSPINENETLYTWNAGAYSGCTTGLYVATGTSTGQWGNSSHPYDIPNNKSITDLSFGIWADSKGNDNAYDAVIARKDSSGDFHLYLPSTVTGAFKLYYSFDSLKIDGADVTNGASINLTEGEHALVFKQTKYDSGTKDDKTLTVYKTNDVATLLFQTKRNLFTETTSSLVDNLSDYKDLETKGNVYLYDEEGKLVNGTITADKDETVLKKIKGRGNSTFEASMKLYGKYAYNFNLGEKVSLVKGATKAKKWSLLANNVDHSMMRNTFIYSLADDIGIKYAPNTRLVNVYDNGYYLGAYVIAEKVEYGGSTLMKDMENLDDFHEGTFGEDYDKSLEQTKSSYNSMEYKYSKAKSGAGFTYEYDNNEFKKYNFLLEFELQERVDNEASWFKSKKGQNIVVKYPEFATQNEMKWIMDIWDTAESAVYASGEEDLDEIKNYIDVDSFAKMYLIQELTKNLDACATSYYIHNDLDRNKLVASPVWDYDWSMGSYYLTKTVINGSSSGALDDPEGWFVKNKSMYDGKNGSTSTYNFQAQLTQNNAFWNRCKYIWTNQMYAAIDKYVDTDATGSNDTGLITGEWKDSFSKTLKMNFARWHDAPNGENWGTKKTNNYKYGSKAFDPGNQNLYSNTTTENWDNTIYYLNDWIAERSEWMEDNGLNTNSVYGITLNDVTMTPTHNGDSVDIQVSIDATQNNTQMDNSYKFYALFVDGVKVGEYPITQTSRVNLVQDVETRICVVGYVKNSNGDMVDYKQCPTEKFTYEEIVPEYRVENVSFTYSQSADESTVTVRPSAYVTLDGTQLTNDKINYTIYLNGAVYGTTKTFETPSVEVTLTEGMVNQIYIVVSPVDAPTLSGTSITQKFPCKVPETKVSVTIKFKSSSSVRYIPSIKVNGNTTAEKMTIGEEIGWNASGTQSYNWFTANVELVSGKATNITFTNSYSMNASVSVTAATDGEEFYFGVDNLNNGNKAVDLTDKGENIRNFVKSATHMLTNDVTATGVATTSLGGTIYKLGDTDVDNKLTAIDATKTQMALVGKTELSETGEALADFNLDGRKSIMDVTLTQVYLTQ